MEINDSESIQHIDFTFELTITVVHLTLFFKPGARQLVAGACLVS